jgi:hypothetical protein
MPAEAARTASARPVSICSAATAPRAPEGAAQEVFGDEHDAGFRQAVGHRLDCLEQRILRDARHNDDARLAAEQAVQQGVGCLGVREDGKAVVVERSEDPTAEERGSSDRGDRGVRLDDVEVFEGFGL